MLEQHVRAVLTRRWRRKGEHTAWWRIRTLAVIALLMTEQEGTVRDVYRMSPEAMREAIDRMPSCAKRWVRLWVTLGVVAPVSRMSPRAVRRAVVSCCGYRPSALLRASWAR